MRTLIVQALLIHIILQSAVPTSALIVNSALLPARTMGSESTALKGLRGGGDLPVADMNKDMLWVFGYGSLIWKPPEGFQFARACPGGIQGFTRRMWQGSTDHRGVPGNPGLVATLIRTSDLPEDEQDANELCWGMCYGYPAELREEVVAYLDYREKDGYDQCVVDVYLQPEEGGAMSETPDIRGVLLYVAQTDNPQYLGPLDSEKVAQQIALTVGPSGTNREYLFKMAEGLRQIKVHDSHVFGIEQRVRELPAAAVSKVSAFVGDGRYAGDGGWMLQKLWDCAPWQEENVFCEQDGGPGCYSDAASSSTTDTNLCSLSTSQVLAKIGWPKSMALTHTDIQVPLHNHDSAVAAAAIFPDGGGLLSYEEKSGVFRHLLLTQSAVLRLPRS
mmetsp:Transcript_38187/g.61561  ORF Transcript_38187/g.61561 Transcript_38187/m.61561 type:complete len:389 (-) Transcript_38187:64-1230(-)